MRAAAIGLFIAVMASTAHAQRPLSAAVVTQEFICDTMPTAACHASSIIFIDGDPAVAWFGGSYEGCADVGIWFSRRAGGTWGTPVRIADGAGAQGEQFACWNPVLHRLKDGSVLLFYKVGPNPRAWWGMMKRSFDGGTTWSAPMRIPDGCVGPVRNHPLETASGELLCPSSTESTGWKVWIERTPDAGRTWTLLGPLNDTSAIEAIQPALVDMGVQGILAVGRTKQGRLFQTVSRDTGWTWEPMTLGGFLCSNSGVDAVRLRDGRVMLVYNHARNDPARWNVGRDTMAVAVCADGKHWQAGVLLEVERGAEFSYPSVALSPDGLVHITYTWKRQKIRHLVLDPTKVPGRPFRGVEWE